MNDIAVHAAVSAYEIASRLDVPWSHACVEEWIDEEQLYVAGGAPFLTGAEIDSVTGDAVRLLRFGGEPTSAELSSALRWAADACSEQIISVEARNAIELLGGPGLQVLVERVFDGATETKSVSSNFADAPGWVRDGLAASLRNGVAARDFAGGDPRFGEQDVSELLARLDSTPDVFVYRLADGQLAAVGRIGADDWDGSDLIELLDLVGDDLRRSDDLLADVADALGVNRVRGAVTVGRDPNGPRVLAGLLARGWNRVRDQVLMPAGTRDCVPAQGTTRSTTERP
ncbi:MAG: hypothetical protein ACRDXX_19185 [Stackebrandtia sp.]